MRREEGGLNYYIKWTMEWVKKKARRPSGQVWSYSINSKYYASRTLNFLPVKKENVL